MSVRTNILVRNDVRSELAWDSQIDDSRVQVEVKEGEVTLSGVVPTYHELLRAEEDAYRVVGVTEVDNMLFVGSTGEAVEDFKIQSNCADVIERDQHIPHGAVSVSVTEGWVYLSGEVRRHYQRRLAEQAVRRIEGVVGVTNDITLTTEPIPSDVAERIARAIKRNAVIDGSPIEVSNVASTIYLKGTVRSWAGQDEAEEIAWAAPGVRHVVNQIIIANC